MAAVKPRSGGAAAPAPLTRLPARRDCARVRQVFFSGALCFLLDEHMFTFGWTLKVPLYLMLGVSICFAFTFSAMDMVNWAVTVCQGAGARPLVETPVQVYLVLGTSVVLGAVFGFTFGFMDVEDARGVDLRTRLAQVESVCLPIGAIAGAVAGVLNELLGSRASASYGRVGAREIYDDEDGI